MSRIRVYKPDIVRQQTSDGIEMPLHIIITMTQLAMVGTHEIVAATRSIEKEEGTTPGRIVLGPITEVLPLVCRGRPLELTQRTLHLVQLLTGNQVRRGVIVERIKQTNETLSVRSFVNRMSTADILSRGSALFVCRLKRDKRLIPFRK